MYSSTARDTRPGGPGAAGFGPTPPGFAVIGTGRCGTGYMAAFLRAAGLDCGHEQWWTPVPRRVRPEMDGDSSWLALPDIEVGRWSGPVVHITRHPVAVVASLVGIGFFAGGARREFTGVALTEEPELASMDPLWACIEWWARWNARCAAVADVTIRIEDLPARLCEIGDAIGHQIDADAAGSVSTTINHRSRAEVDEQAVWRLLDGRAGEFGYRDGACG